MKWNLLRATDSQTPMNVQSRIKAGAAIAFVVIVFSYSYWSPLLQLPSNLPDGDRLGTWLEELGLWGPAAVIALMTTAILVSPLPSAPIALASGAIYGHFWGGLYVLAGSQLGAMAAFGLSRVLGHDMLRDLLGDRLRVGLAGSQNFLMGTVFVSRLLPFISFDIVSYAAGLTILTFWRFAFATLAGIIPASFLLAHFGQELVSAETHRILVAVIVLGALTALPFAAGFFATRSPAKNHEEKQPK